MKQILMMRHAKSSWESSVQTDHARPLNRRGKRDAPAMAELLFGLNLVPEFIVSSDSKRTCETLDLMMEFWQASDCVPQIDIDGSFYHAPASEWLQKLVELPDQYSNVMFLGHNPGAEEFVMHFSNEHHMMPTAAIAQFQFDADQWANCVDGRLAEIFRPKEI